MTPIILLTDIDLGDPELEAHLLQKHLNAHLVVRQCRTEADVLEAVRTVNPDGMIVQWAPVSAEVLEAAPKLKVISRIGIGLDMIDLEAAEARGVAVRNVAHYCVEEVATHAVALGLSLWRKLTLLDSELRSGKWDAAASATNIKRLSNSTLGLIGLGKIGRVVADSYSHWGMKVIAYDPLPGSDPYERVELERIAAESDLISLHAPLVPATHHIVTANFLSLCEKRPILVNVSRGALIDPAALTAALHAGQVVGAGLDVFEDEPLPMDDPLRSAPNTVMTPHAAWCSVDALPALRKGAVQNIVDALSTRNGAES